MTNGEHQMDIFIQEATRKVALDPENATEREFNLAIAGYVAYKIEASRLSLRQLLLPLGAGGGGIVGVIEGVRVFLAGGF